MPRRYDLNAMVLIFIDYLNKITTPVYIKLPLKKK